MKEYVFKFEAPIVFTYEFSLSEEDFVDGDVKDYISKMIDSGFRDEADTMYQYVKEDLHYYIENGIRLAEVETK